MSIDQTDKVDFISTSPDNKVVLTISDHLEWDDEGAHLLLLQRKLNAYIKFIEGGQIYENYPKARNSQLIISLKLKFEPNKTGLEFLTQCAKLIIEIGVGFEWTVFESKV